MNCVSIRGYVVICNPVQNVSLCLEFSNRSKHMKIVAEIFVISRNVTKSVNH